jgi:kynurenine formamidase
MQLSLDALRIPKTGRAYDLSSGWWPGMPMAEGLPKLQVLTHRSPAGQRNQRDLEFLNDNRVGFGFVSELMMCTTHTGTHIDAIAHVTAGPDAEWFGGHSAFRELGDFGPLNGDASELGPLLARGIVIDVPGALGVPFLEPHQGIGRAEIEAALERQQLEVREGDVVLIRTGTMAHWPDAEKLEHYVGAGLNIDGAEALVDSGMAAIAGDTVCLEMMPSGIDGDPQPVHRLLIQQRGIPILEWVNPEELVRDGVSEFLFVCLPLHVHGATGSLVRPLAIV